MVPDIGPEALNLALVEFKLPPPKEPSEEDRTSLIAGSLTRIWDGAEELRSLGESLSPESIQAGGNSASEMWMLLLVRMITRVAEPPSDMSGDETTEDNKEVVENDFYARQDQLRQTLCDYIMADFPSR